MAALNIRKMLANAEFPTFKVDEPDDSNQQLAAENTL